MMEMEDIFKRFLNSVVIENQSFRLPCYAHTLQFTVKDVVKGLAGVQSSLEKVSKIAKLSHSSTLVADRFEKIQASISDANKTGWNSQYEMVVSVIDIPPSDLNDILVQTQHRKLCLKSLDYQALNEFISSIDTFC